MRTILVSLCLVGLAGCAADPDRWNAAMESIGSPPVEYIPVGSGPVWVRPDRIQVMPQPLTCYPVGGGALRCQ